VGIPQPVTPIAIAPSNSEAKGRGIGGSRVRGVRRVADLFSELNHMDLHRVHTWREWT
jgi:hypothetical protein